MEQSDEVRKNPQEILTKVASDFGVTYEDLVSKSKIYHLYQARMEVTKRMFTAGFIQSDIARALNRQPGTIDYYISKIKKDAINNRNIKSI